MSLTAIRRLQSVLHAAARLITDIRRYEHITPTLRDTVHWLPMSQCIIFKVTLIIFDCYSLMCALAQPLLRVRDYDQPTTVTSSSHAHGPLGLAAAVSACADQQFGTNFHRICEAHTLGNSLNVGLTAGYLSVYTVTGESDRC